MNNSQFYPIGSLVRSIAGEQDTDDDGADRQTGLNAWGWIDDYSSRMGYSVCFTNGTSVFLEQSEIDDRKLYDVCTPEAMAGRLKEIRDSLDQWDKDEHVPVASEWSDVLMIVGA